MQCKGLSTVFVLLFCSSLRGPHWARVDKNHSQCFFSARVMLPGLSSVPSAISMEEPHVLLWIEFLASSKDTFSLLARWERHSFQVVETRRFWAGWTSIWQASAFTPRWVSGLCGSGKIPEIFNWHKMKLCIKGTCVVGSGRSSCITATVRNQTCNACRLFSLRSFWAKF